MAERGSRERGAAWSPLRCDPADVFRFIAAEPHSFFLDSSLADSKLGRWAFMGSHPFLVFAARGRSWSVRERGRVTRGLGAPFEVLRRLVARHRREPLAGGPPLAAGAVGYAGYEAGRLLERIGGARPPGDGLPDLCFAFYNEVAAFDLVRREAWAGGPRLSAWIRAAVRGETPPRRPPFELTSPLGWDRTRAQYLEAVESVRDSIARGEIYQANLTRRAAATWRGDPYDLHRRLRAVSAAPFAAYLNFGRVRICSASPERFLKVRGARVETRPIKGTRPRGADRAADRIQALDLVRSPKDHAEHVMIVDLERNDLGRVCETGTVRVAELATLERYPQVFHLTSTVEGRLRRGVTATEALAALFPGGSITGAPKIRAEEILAGLEPGPRGIYTGAIGYLSFTGDADFSIAIRTIALVGSRLSFGVGGGIVADSDPTAEWDETNHKAAGMLAALGAPLTDLRVGFRP